jgi:hypothetical protein
MEPEEPYPGPFKLWLLLINSKVLTAFLIPIYGTVYSEACP